MTWTLKQPTPKSVPFSVLNDGEFFLSDGMIYQKLKFGRAVNLNHAMVEICPESWPCISIKIHIEASTYQ